MKHKQLTFRERKFHIDSTLDPSKLRFVQEYFLLDNLTINLVNIDSDENYSNQLAEKITFSNDNRTLKVQLREAYFSDGTQITSKDVINSLKRGILYGSPHFDARSIYLEGEKLKKFEDNIKGLQIIDKQNLLLNLNKPSKEILYYLNLTDTAILPPSVVKKKNLIVKDWKDVVSGPYSIIIKNKKVVLKANHKSLLFSDSMPEKIYYEDLSIDETVKELDKKSNIFGYLSFKEYLSNEDVLNSIENIVFEGNKTDSIFTLDLNSSNHKFQSTRVRQWIRLKILDSYPILR